MLTRKTQYAWMALGGLICLFGLVLACKLRDGNRAVAQPQPLSRPVLSGSSEWGSPSSPPPLASPKMPAPETMLPPPRKELLTSEKPAKTASEPKVTLEMPFPGLIKPTRPSSAPATPTLPSPRSGTATYSPIVPASFAPNTPTPPEKKSPVTPSPSSSLPLSGPKPTINPEPKPATPTSPPKTPPTEKLPEASRQSSWNAPAPVGLTTPSVERELVRMQPGEPPLAPSPGPVQLYHTHNSETLQDIARRTLGSSERAADLHKLNPALKVDEPLRSGTTVRLPADACVQGDDVEPVKPLPALRPKPTAAKAKALPLTGTYQCSLDEKGQLTLPRALRDQLSGSDTVLVSPGPDKCLWLTNQSHLERLGERLEQSHANENDVRVFKRLYFAQTEKLSVNGEGRVAIPERLGEFAGLHQEVVLVGIDDHFEVWDAGRWRSYTQHRSADTE
jgi:MraZ protein